jgi:mono/diheme cytochrome c family protein
MKKIIATVIFTTTLIAAPMLDHAEAVDLGMIEYTNSCAVCHGDKGKGDGPLVEWLKKRPTNLTTIQKNNGGQFPFDRLYKMIDGREVGREAIGSHGPIDMPIWGAQFSTEQASRLREFGTPKDLESYTQGRIIALIGYIHTLQEK